MMPTEDPTIKELKSVMKIEIGHIHQTIKEIKDEIKEQNSEMRNDVKEQSREIRLQTEALRMTINDCNESHCKEETRLHKRINNVETKVGENKEWIDRVKGGLVMVSGVLTYLGRKLWKLY